METFSSLLDLFNSIILNIELRSFIEIGDFESSLVVFDDALEYNQKQTDPGLRKGRHKHLDVYCLPQSSFDLPKRAIRNNSIFFVIQILKDVETIYGDTAGFDKTSSQFKV